MKTEKALYLKKRGFSLIELIFIIAVLAIIAAVGVPKLLDVKSNALATSIKQDITTITNSIQSYHLLNSSIEKISDAVTVDSSRWEIEDTKLQYKIGDESCISIELSSTQLLVSVESSPSDLCEKILSYGISSQTLDLF